MTRLSLAAFLAVFVGSSTVALADARPFTFTYDTYAVGKGGFEYEQWAEWQTHKPGEHGYDRFDFRHEFEFGITDYFDLAIYLPSWHYEDSKELKGTKFDSVDIEAIVYLSNPRKDPLGVGLYAETKIGEDELELEFKLLLQKDWGKWVFAYNLVLETAIEGAFDSKAENEVEGELKHVFGVSYALTPKVLVGAEAVVESVYADWSVYEHTTVWAGPAISYQPTDKFFITATAMYQFTDTQDEPDWRLRVIAGFSF
ncbi:MAG TPA: hypothetical protein VF796_13560 [Humisphaera sp.]